MSMDISKYEPYIINQISTVQYIKQCRGRFAKELTTTSSEPRAARKFLHDPSLCALLPAMCLAKAPGGEPTTNNMHDIYLHIHNMILHVYIYIYSYISIVIYLYIMTQCEKSFIYIYI